MSIFSERADLTIVHAYELHAQMQKRLNEKKGTQVTDLYFFQTNTGIECVRKKSFKGRWLAFKGGIAHFFGQESRLDAEKTFKKLSDMCKRVSSAYDPAFQKALATKNLDESTLHGDIQDLAEKLEKVKQHISSEMARNGNKKVKAEIIKNLEFLVTPKSATDTFDADKASDLLKNLGLSDKESSALVSRLHGYADAGHLVAVLQDPNSDLKEKQTQLLLACYHALRTTPESAPEFQALESTLATVSKMGASTPVFSAPIQEKYIAFTLADAFISESGLEGGVDAQPYAALAVECIDRLNLSSPEAKSLKQVLQHGINLRDSSISSDSLREKIHHQIDAQDSPHQRCILYGGWAKHAIVYEIEKNPDGRYSFRIYNEGDGNQFHDKQAGAYKDKYAGCIAITDIPEKLLFRRSFLASLQSLCALSTEATMQPSQLLAEKLLPLIDGNEERVDERLQRYVSPQRSGTCTYRSLQAFFAHTLSAEDYKIFKCEYKIHLLKRYMPDLEASCTSITKDNYLEHRRSCTMLRLSLQKFANGAAKLTPLLTKEKLSEVQLVIAQYEHLLNRYESEILKVEKELTQKSVATLSEEGRWIQLQGSPKYAAPLCEPKYSAQASTSPLSPCASKLLARIEALDPQSVEKVDACLKDFAEAIANKQIEVNEFIFIYDLFFKKMGSHHAWDTLACINPARLQDMHTIIHYLVSQTANARVLNHRFELHTMAFATFYAYECSFRSLPEAQRLLQSDFPSFLANVEFSDFRHMHTLDPFWRSIFEDLKTHAERFQAQKLELPSLSQDDFSNPTYTLPDALCESIYTWLHQPQQEQLLKEISSSVSQDRDAQDAEIKVLQDAQRQKIHSLESEKQTHESALASLRQNEATLLQQKAYLETQKNEKSWQRQVLQQKIRQTSSWHEQQSLQRQINSLLLEEQSLNQQLQPLYTWEGQVSWYIAKIATCEENIAQCHQIITSIPIAVKDDLRYWPQCFVDVRKSQQGPALQFLNRIFTTQATSSTASSCIAQGQPRKYDCCRYLFSSNTKKPEWNNRLPPEFHRLFDTATILTQMPARTEFEQVPHRVSLKTTSEHNPHGDAKLLYHYTPSTNSYGASIAWNHSRYTSDFDSKDFMNAYFHLHSAPHLDETNLPKHVTDHAHTDTFPKSMSIQMRTELFAIHRKDIQLDAALSYFTENLDSLSDHNMFLIFHSFLFESNLLLDALTTPEYAEMLHPKLVDFFQRAILHAKETEQYGLAANLVWTASSVQKFIDFASKKRVEKGLPPLNPVIEKKDVVSLMETAVHQKHSNHWPVVFEAVAAAANNLGIDTTDVRYLSAVVTAHILQKQFPNTSHKCSLRQEQASDTGLQIKKELTKIDQVSDALIPPMQKMLREVFPSIVSDASMKRKGVGVLEASDASVQVSFSTGELVSSDPSQLRVYKNPLGREYIDLLRNQKLYPQDFDFSQLKTRLEDNYLYIHDSKHNRFLAIDTSTTPKTIYVKIKNEFAKFIPEESRESYCSHKESIVSFHHLQINSTVYVCDPNDFTPKYKIESKCLKTLDTPALTLTSENIPQIFTNSESQDCSFFFANDRGQIQKIVFNRHNLSLSYDAKSKKWLVDQQKGWHLADNQFAPHLAPSTGYLVFENDKGQKKVLIPVLEPQFVIGEKHALDFPYAFKFDVEAKRKVETVSYALVDNMLVPESIEARLHLIRIYLEKGLLDHAEKLLFTQAEELLVKKLTDSEYNILEKIACLSRSQNTSGSALRIRLQALYLLEHNNWAFPPDEKRDPAKHLEEKRKLYTAYLNRLGHTAPIDKHVELFLLDKLFLPQCSDHKCSYRKAELEGTTPLPELPDITYAQPTFAWPTQGTDIPIHSGHRPTMLEKLQYKKCRLAKTYPFDYTNLADFRERERFLQYLPLLENECQSLSSIEKGKNNGLLQLLYYLSCNERYQSVSGISVQKRAQELLEGIENRLGKPKQTHKPYTEKASAPQKKPFQITHGISSLYALRTGDLSIDELSFLPQLAEKSFSKNVAATTTTARIELFSSKSPEITDETIRAQFESAQKDLDAAQGIAEEDSYILKAHQDLSALRETVSEKRQKEKKTLSSIEANILESVTSALTQDPTSALSFASKKRTLPTIQQLCILSARKDGAGLIKKLYPELSDEGIEKLQKALNEYLQQKRFVQHLDRSVSQIDACIHANAEEKPMLMTALAKSLEVKSSYEMTHEYSTVFLVIETTLNIKLRADQITNIQTFATSMDSSEDIVLQMIMGSGKTAILQPILAFLFAKPDRLSTVTVPEALMQAVTLGLSQTLGSSVSQLVYTIDYNRDKSKDTQYVEMVHARLIEAKNNQACVLLTPRQKNALVTSMSEGFYDFVQAKQNNDAAALAECTPRLKAITAICRLLELEEVAQIDEIDMLMNSEVIFKFPVGAREKVDQKRALLVSELVYALAKDPEIYKKVSIDFVDKFQHKRDPNYKKEGASISPDIYYSVVHPKLVCHARTLLIQNDPSWQGYFDRDTSGYITHFIGKTSPFDEEIRNTLHLGEEEAISQQLPKALDALTAVASENSKEGLVAKKILFTLEMKQWIETNIQSEDAKNSLGVLAKSIEHILLESLSKECGSHYDRDQNKSFFVARPYFAPNSPKPTMPSDPYEQIVYTMQQTLFRGIPEEAVIKIFRQLQLDAARSHDDTGMLVNETSAYKEFQRILGDKAKEFTFSEHPPSEKLIAELQQAMSKDEKSILHFMEHYVFDQVELFEASISSTPQTMAGVSWQCCGYTGTLHTGIMPKDMRIETALGTDGKTILAIEKKMQAKISRVQCMAPDKRLTDQVLDEFMQDAKYEVFIDSGGWLKEENTEEFAKRLMAACNKRTPPIEGVIFHDEDGREICLQKIGNEWKKIPREASLLRPNEGKVLTIIQQKYETGTNIPQRPNAKAFMSVRKNMTMRDALQSSFRMRQILVGQSVSFGISQETKEHIALGILSGLLKQEQFKSLFGDDVSDEKIREVAKQMQLEKPIEEALISAFREAKTQFPSKSSRERQILLLQSFSKHLDVCSKDVWHYFIANQAIDQQRKNWLAAKQKMQEVIEKPVRSILADPDIPLEDRADFFNEIQELFIKKQKDAPFHEMAYGSRVVDSQTAIDYEIAHHLEVIQKIQESKKIRPKVKEALIKRIQALYNDSKPGDVTQILKDRLTECVNINEIASSLTIAEAEHGQEQQVEQQVQQQVQQQTQQQVQQQVEQDMEEVVSGAPLETVSYQPLVGLRPGDANFCTALFTHSFQTVSHRLDAEVLPILDQSSTLEYSPNLFLRSAPLTDPQQKFYHLPGRFLMIIQGPTKFRYVLVSHEDAENIKKGLLSAKSEHLHPPQSISLVSLDGKMTAKYPLETQCDIAAHAKVILQAKILTGAIRFSNEEVDAIEQMLRASASNEHPLKQRAEDFTNFYCSLIKNLSETKKRYAAHPLRRRLQQLAM